MNLTTALRDSPPAHLIQRVASTAIGTYAAYVLHGLLHPDLLRASASEADQRRPLPGDELVAEPDWCTTFSTIVHAPREAVWPWLLQMGYGRGGWYTWSPYDNGGARSVDRIIPSLQSVQVGDILPDGPRAADGYGVWWVRQLSRPGVMVLASKRNPITGREVKDGEGSPDPYLNCSWAFTIEELDERTSQLLVRVRARLCGVTGGRMVARAARAFFGAGDTVMERTLLNGVRARAEHAYAASFHN